MAVSAITGDGPDEIPKATTPTPGPGRILYKLERVQMGLTLHFMGLLYWLKAKEGLRQFVVFTLKKSGIANCSQCLKIKQRY